MDNIVGNKIAKYRREKRLTLTELANKTNLRYQTIQKYERGEVTNIPLDKLEIIAAALGVNPADLMGWSSAPGTGHFQPGSEMSYLDSAMNAFIKEVENDYGKKLSKQETYLLDAYRNATDEAKMEAFMILMKGKNNG